MVLSRWRVVFPSPIRTTAISMETGFQGAPGGFVPTTNMSIVDLLFADSLTLLLESATLTCSFRRGSAWSHRNKHSSLTRTITRCTVSFSLRHFLFIP